MALPDYRAMAAQMATQYNVPLPLFDSLIRSESSYNPLAIGKLGEVGLGQLMPGTAAELGVNPFDPRENLAGAAVYLRRQYDRYGNWRDAVAAYKAGTPTAAGYAAADKVLSAAGLTATGTPEARSTADAYSAQFAAAGFSWTNPNTWGPWLKTRAVDILVGGIGLLLLAVGIMRLVNVSTGGALVRGIEKGAGLAR